MAIDPTTTTTVKVGELASAVFSGTDLVPHEVGGILKKGTLSDLATFIGSSISVTSGVGFRAVTVTDGQTLPATTQQEFILVGPGTYPNVGGGATITTTEELNALVSNGTFWFIGVEIPIEANVSGAFEPAIATGTTSQYWRGDKTWQTLNKAAVGLANVDNTSDANKPISIATQNALNLKADTSQLHDPVTIDGPNPNGLTLVGQKIGINIASSTLNGALRFTDWNTFNNKIGGSGETNYIPKFTGSGTLGNSLIFDNGTNVGIGTTSPNRLLTVSGTQSVMSFNATSYRNTTIGSDSVGSFIVYDDTASAYRMVINSSGNVGIGTTSPLSGYQLHLKTSSANNFALLLDNTTGSNTTQHFANNGTVKSFINLNNLGGAFEMGTSSTFDLKFFTNATERLKINSIGQLISPPTYANTSSVAANMTIAADGTIYRSTSSLKYKTDVRDYDKGLEVIEKMRPVYYKGKTNWDTQFAGLIAEEIDKLGLKEFVQYATDGSPDALSYQNMVALLIKGMQEQQVQIKELKAEIEILKSK